MPVVPFIPLIATVVGAAGSIYSANKNARTAASMQQNASTSAVSGPTVMPVADGAAVQAAKRKSILDQISSRGRASTLLTDPSGDKLGG